MKKVLSLLFVAALLLGCMIPAVTAADPAAISSADDFLAMTDGDYYLTSDIDFENVNYTDYLVESFSGTLDGKGYSLKNIKITGTGDNIGVFMGLAGNGATTIKNLTVEASVTSSGENTVGVLAAYNNKNNLTTLENVTLDATFSGKARAFGGFFGASVYTNIENCYVYGAFSFEDTGAHKARHLGGFIGETKDNVTNIYGSANFADISYSTAGGYRENKSMSAFVGVAGTRSSATKEEVNIYNCVNFGDVYNGNNNRDAHTVGAFIATTQNIVSATISGCINFGTLTGGYWNGGLVGHNNVASLTIENCAIYGQQAKLASTFGTFPWVARGVGQNNQNGGGIAEGSTTETVSNCLDKTAETFAAGTSDDIAIVAAQETTAAESKFNFRMVAALDNTASYTNIGFEFTTVALSGTNSEWTSARECKTVFTEITANGNMDKYTAEDFSADKLFALTVKGAPATVTESVNDSFLVIARPYATGASGTVYGDWTAALWSAGSFVTIGNLA